MKSFIVKLAVFLGVPIILYFLLFVISTDHVKNMYKVTIDDCNLVLGDSHVNYAFSQNNTSRNRVYYTSDSQSYRFTYYILKHLLQQNPKRIQEVTLAFSYHNLMYFEKRQSIKAYATYFHILPLDLQISYIRQKMRQPLFFMRTFLGVKYYKEIYNLKLHKIMSASNKETVDTPFINRRIAYQFYYSSNKAFRSFDEVELLYLKHCVDLCKEHHIDLQLLTTPLHPNYRANIPDHVRSKFKETLSMLDVKYLDYQALPDFDTNRSYFLKDGDHLSKQGAKKFEEFFDTY